MKRSEMLAIIKTCIKLNHSDEAHQFEHGEISLGRFAEICSEKILNRIEKEGMLPPEIQSDIYLRSECEYATVNEWEPEDLDSNNRFIKRGSK